MSVTDFRFQNILFWTCIPILFAVLVVEMVRDYNVWQVLFLWLLSITALIYTNLMFSRNLNKVYKETAEELMVLNKEWESFALEEMNNFSTRKDA